MFCSNSSSEALPFFFSLNFTAHRKPKKSTCTYVLTTAYLNIVIRKAQKKTKLKVGGSSDVHFILLLHIFREVNVIVGTLMKIN